MSFYRTVLAAAVAVALASPVFADDTTTTATPADASATTTQTTSATDQATATATETKVNINKASKKDLMKVKDLSAGQVKAILAYRKKHNGFKSLDELSSMKAMKGMSADKMKEVTDQLTIE